MCSRLTADELDSLTSQLCGLGEQFKPTPIGDAVTKRDVRSGIRVAMQAVPVAGSGNFKPKKLEPHVSIQSGLGIIDSRDLIHGSPHNHCLPILA